MKRTCTPEAEAGPTWATATAQSSTAKATTAATRGTETRAADAVPAAGPPGVVPAATDAQITAALDQAVASSTRGRTAPTPDTNVITHILSTPAQCCLSSASWTSCSPGSPLLRIAPRDTRGLFFCLLSQSKWNSLLGQTSSKVPSDPRRDVSKPVNPEAAENPGDFANFPEISPATQKGLIARGITHLFPVQYMTFRRIMNDEDLLVRDLTGSGKTLGFCLPMVEKFRRDRLFGLGKPQAMILAPTRELALQIAKELELLKHSPREYNVLCVYGGSDIHAQIAELRRGVDIFVGTTGRVKDHIERRNFDFSLLKFACLDEADIMLNMGFKEDVEYIMKTIKDAGPKNVQAMMFSATVPKWVYQVASMFLKPGYGSVDLAQNLTNKTSKTVSHLAINVPWHNIVSTLADILICYGGSGQTIVFCSKKAEANQLLLTEKIKSSIEVMHGDIAQNQREVTLKRFKEKKFNVLVATDVASRGLDIPSVDLVIQVEPPKDPETYIHRSGRTARAGRSGVCITFYTNKQKMALQHIEKVAGITMQKIGVPQPE